MESNGCTCTNSFPVFSGSLAIGDTGNIGDTGAIVLAGEGEGEGVDSNPRALYERVFLLRLANKLDTTELLLVLLDLLDLFEAVEEFEAVEALDFLDALNKFVKFLTPVDELLDFLEDFLDDFLDFL